MAYTLVYVIIFLYLCTRFVGNVFITSGVLAHLARAQHWQC